MKVIIVGGAAGGSACASRLRRLDERADIVLVDRGSFALQERSGLPLPIPRVIGSAPEQQAASEQYFRTHFAVDTRSGCEAIALTPCEHTLDIRNLATGEVRKESYDKLVLAVGALPLRPQVPGAWLPGIFEVRTADDVEAIRAWIERGAMPFAAAYNQAGIRFAQPTRRAVVVGGDFAGLETAESLIRLGFDVTLIERRAQVLPGLDHEFAKLVQHHVERHGLRLVLGESVEAFIPREGGTVDVELKSGRSFTADVVLLALGIQPDTTLARAAGLAIGKLGGIRVDEQMRTSDPDIFAIGCAAEVRDFVTGEWCHATQTGPAHRQGRIVADVIAGRDVRFRGVQGTSIVALFDGAAAWTGITEKALRKSGDADFEKVYLFPNSHAGFFPGATPIALKLIFHKSDGRVLGAEAFGEDGAAVDKRITALALAVQLRATIYDLEDAELCSSPQFGSAKDAVNVAGMIAADVLDGDMPIAHWDRARSAFLLDVRQPEEIIEDGVQGATVIPLPELRTRLGELPRDREIFVVCRSAQRAYFATRILLQNGFRARSLSGGTLSRAALFRV